jgi:hypothetical protein
MKPSAEDTRHTFDPADSTSVLSARETMREHSIFDGSQADAIIDVLTRSVALVQGPPGTGKTFAGVELVKILLQNKVGPIILIAYTNHALDNIVHDIIEKGITTNVVRLGSRSKDDLVSSYSIEELEKLQPLSRNLQRESGTTWHRMKDLAKDMEGIRDSISRHDLSLHEVEEWIELNQPDHYASLVDDAPTWMPELLDHLAADVQDGFEVVRRAKKSSRHDEPFTILSVWKDSIDLDTLSALGQPLKLKPTKKTVRDASNQEDVNAFDILDDDEPDDGAGVDPTWAWMAAPAVPHQSGLDATASASAFSPQSNTAVVSSPFASASSFIAVFGPIPRVPTFKKTIETLGGESLWSMSKDERGRLFAHWCTQAWEESSELQFVKLHKARREHEKAKEENEQLRTQVSFFIGAGLFDITKHLNP